MPLRDHFRPPLSQLRHWESFHARWAAAIADTLEGDVLPPGYYAEVQVHVGRVEVDVAAFEEQSAVSGAAAPSAVAMATTSAKVWTPPAPALTMPCSFPDRQEVLIFSSEAGPTLIAAVELVSPRNKDRPESRRAFAAKCAAYLQQAIGLMVLDVVTSRRANLHNDLIDFCQLGERFRLAGVATYGVAYRPMRHPAGDQIDVWHQVLTVGQHLPVLPLPLDKGQSVPLDLEETYATACRRMRLP